MTKKNIIVIVISILLIYIAGYLHGQWAIKQKLISSVASAKQELKESLLKFRKEK